MKLYTKTGDDGSTGLYGPERVSKTHVRVEAYGTVDELNSVVGLARAHNMGSGQPDATLDADLEYLQNALFDVGADLATRQGSVSASKISRMDAEDAAFLEAMIDRYQEVAPVFKGFVHPGGTATAAALHVARTVARRAERVAIGLAGVEEVNPHVLVYLNRISDLLFVMARAANQTAGLEEHAWTVKGRR
ncbi:ATP--cob(I)alamin adenosyltransferase [Deinococcus aetherius]|uniref:Corrinoid adenosyltransferase n=1 Tax=Deinococcus aetherius TaxID=200252 RepID=A0ABN6RFI9_9DEIO|nr:cob(I)yrinic acid a,c-diamide adenosyltransferase [Deinococcus aetherius]BDP41424.1 ATP--cob(I)alamin adenosyltransferase [Deinococcus aetherius]